MECHHCEDMSLSSLSSRLAFFSESNPPLAPSCFILPGTCLGKRAFQRPEMSELSPAVNPRTSLFPHREISPILFTCPDQNPSAAVSNLVLLGGSNDGKLDYSLSLAASGAVGLVQIDSAQQGSRPACQSDEFSEKRSRGDGSPSSERVRLLQLLPRPQEGWWAQLNLRSLRAAHVPGKLNLGADMQSQSNVPSDEWTLYPQTVRVIWESSAGQSSLLQKTTLTAKLIFQRTVMRWPTIGPTSSFMLFP